MRKMLLVLVGIAITLVLTSCAFLNWSQSNVEVYLTDAVLPIENVDRILVTIDRILLVSEDATVIVSDEATTVNLLDLVGQELYVGSVPEGTYGQLRFEISSATITVDGIDHPLRINSGSLKYNLQGFHVTSGTSIVLDFDLSRSIKVTGSATSSDHGNNPVEYHMTPVIHVRYGHLYDITGRVLENNQGLPHALVALFETDQPSPTAVTLTHKESAHWQAGGFKLCKVRPGNYELKIYTNWQSAPDPDRIFESDPATTLTVTVENEDVNLGDINLQ